MLTGRGHEGDLGSGVVLIHYLGVDYTRIFSL